MAPAGKVPPSLPVWSFPTRLTQKVLYTRESARKEYYPIPEALNTIDVLDVLHNHTLLANTFWPWSETEVVLEKRGTTELVISSSAASTRATMSTTAEGIVYEEEMPLGLKMTIVYRVADMQDQPREKDFPASAGPTSLAESRLYVVEERSVAAPRPLSMLVKVKEGPIEKTPHLVWLLNELGRNGKNMTEALTGLRGLAGDLDDTGEPGKAKAD
ncbi:uncharacterized protein CDV56_109429 [Aspergillus thermomutatus]|uniref:PRELI/MSF1 domain-containing protein n=1 Tax=Aspergillus thermomutatus TaxID=41047 RepID=A0A397HT26_ASPTH|nr:uncharacterized protein CDV56_109429 [Aspergillus thermomutatus]RHZ65997.1 hypothetical protein CDV56_109429 [Aspergillus thermomutatus]